MSMHIWIVIPQNLSHQIHHIQVEINNKIKIQTKTMIYPNNSSFEIITFKGQKYIQTNLQQIGAFKYIQYDDYSDSEEEIAEVQMNKICSIEELELKQSCSIKLLDDESDFENPGSPNIKNLELQKTCSIQLVDPEEYDQVKMCILTNFNKTYIPDILRIDDLVKRVYLLNFINIITYLFQDYIILFSFLQEQIDIQLKDYHKQSLIYHQFSKQLFITLLHIEKNYIQQVDGLDLFSQAEMILVIINNNL
ncbi:hypothetical protein pb186bvf_018816 [Paramecium bursaria]